MSAMGESMPPRTTSGILNILWFGASGKRQDTPRQPLPFTDETQWRPVSGARLRNPVLLLGFELFDHDCD
jgi:hypothetical protein